MNPKVVDEFTDYREQYIDSSIEEILSMMSFKETDTILDIACGAGDLTKRLVQKTGIQSALAFDILPGMIECAKRKNGAENITYIVRDARDCNTYTTMKNSFDKVVAYYALHWMESWQRDVLRWIYDSLKEEGECFLNLVVVTKGGDCFNFIDEAASELPKYQEYVKDFVYGLYRYDGSGDEFEKIMMEIGFTDIKWKMDEVPHELLFKDAKEDKATMKSFLPQLERIPEHLKEDFLEDVHQRFVKKCVKTIDGRNRWLVNFIHVTAKKPTLK